jgi:hypothetical protein
MLGIAAFVYEAVTDRGRHTGLGQLAPGALSDLVSQPAIEEVSTMSDGRRFERQRDQD